MGDKYGHSYASENLNYLLEIEREIEILNTTHYFD